MVEHVLTKKELLTAFKEMGVQEGMILEVHSSMKSLGYVVGGAQSVVDALIEAVGYEGTILMPLQNANNTEPSYWCNPPVTRENWEKIRENTPAFDKKNTDAFMMSAVVDNLRRREGVVISNHPNTAFVAWGKYAKLLCNHQSLNYSLSEESPLARLYELKGSVLLLGVDYTNCTLFHLAEYRSGVRAIQMEGAAVEHNDKTIWKKYLNVEIDSDEFNDIGRLLEENDLVVKGQLGKCTLRLFKGDTAVDIATKCFEHTALGYYLD